MPYYNTANVYGTVRDCSSKSPYYTNDYFRNYTTRTSTQPCFSQPYKTYVSAPSVSIFRKPSYSSSSSNCGLSGGVVIEPTSNCSTPCMSSSSSSNSSGSMRCQSRSGSSEGKVNILVTNKTAPCKPAYQATVAACNTPLTNSYTQISNLVHSSDCTPNGIITTSSAATRSSPMIVSSATTTTTCRAKSPILNCSSATSISTSSQATSANNRQSRRCDDTYEDCNSTSMFTIMKRDSGTTSRSRSPSASSISSCCRHNSSHSLSTPTLTTTATTTNPCQTDKILYGRVRSDSASASRSPHRSSSTVTQTTTAPSSNNCGNSNSSSGNELVATAISDIQLNHTDDLTTQVDYVLKDVS